MKKMNLMMLGLMAMAAGAVQASEPVAAAKTESACASLSAEEQAFAAKLGERQCKLFCMMNADQRKAAMTALEDPVQTADGAVEKIMKEHHLSMAESESKAEAN